MVSPVTDPALLEQLNAPDRKPVTDPVLLAKLNGEAAPKTEKPISSTEDVLNVEKNALPKLGGAILTGLPNLVNQAAAGPQYLGRGIAEGVDKVIGVDPQPRGPVWQPYDTSVVTKPLGLEGYQPKTAAGIGASTFNDVLSNFITPKASKEISEAAPSAGKFTKNVVEDLKSDPILSHEEIKNISTGKYTEADQKGGVGKPEVTNKWLTNLKDLVPKGEIAKELSQDRPFMKLIERLQIAKDKPLTLHDAQEIDEMLGAAADSHYKPGGMTKEGQKILEIQNKFREAITGMKESDIVGGKEGFKAWEDAKYYWSQAMKQRDIEKIVERANLTDNPVTAMKTGFPNLYLNAKKNRAFSKEELAAIKKASQTGVINETMRIIGSRLVPIARVAHGDILGGAGAHAAAMASRAAGTKMQLSRANKISQSISKNVQNRMQGEKSPLPNSVGSDEFNQMLSSLYHGTRNQDPFEKFDLGKSGANDAGNLGTGVYSTPSKTVALHHAGGKDSGVMTLASVMKKPIEIVRDDNYINSINKIAKEIGVKSAPQWSGTKQNSKAFSDEFSQKARAAGYDGAIVRLPNNNRDIVEVVTYDPENIRIMKNIEKQNP